MYISNPAYILTEAKIDAVKSNIAIVTNDNYVGNNTVNRAIAHGLGVTPKMILMNRAGSASFIFIIQPGLIQSVESGGDQSQAVTAADSTNFYVGNGAAYSQSGNGNGETYNWVAIS